MKDLNVKSGKIALIIFLSIVAALLVFKLGVFVGRHEMHFSMDKNRDFFLSKEFTGGHGAAGRVVGVSLPNFIVAGGDNFEKTVFVGSSTMIRKFRLSARPEDIGVDSFVSVLGNPNASGSIEAKFIRITPR